MRNALVLFFVILGGAVHSQVSFYIRPQFNTKTHQAHFDRYRPSTLKDKRKVRTNEYFSFVNNGMFWDRSINIGISMGVEWKGKHAVELGYLQDRFGVSWATAMNYVSIDTTTNVRHGYESYIANSLGSDPTMVRRISASYANTIWKSKQQIIQLRILMGLGFLQTRGASQTDPLDIITYNDPPTFSEQTPVPDLYMYEVSDRAFYNRNFSLYANLGIGIDFVSKKKRNLFSVDVFYLHNRHIIYIHTFNYRVVDKLVTTDYSYTVHSKGSGFYFNLSKKIQLYPWRVGKNKKETPSASISTFF